MLVLLLDRSITFCSEEVAGTKVILPKGTLLSLPKADNALIAKDGGIITAWSLLRILPEATTLHFACHGYPNPEGAIKSEFIMGDEVLTIKGLLPIPLPRAFMVFLNACETVKGETR
jgi:hypothetical protein